MSFQSNEKREYGLSGQMFCRACTIDLYRAYSLAPIDFNLPRNLDLFEYLGTGNQLCIGRKMTWSLEMGACLITITPSTE